MSGPDDAAFLPDDDGMEETLRPTADRVRRVLGSGQMRPAFRAGLRHDLVAAREATIAGNRPTQGSPPAGPRRPAGTGRASTGPGTRRRPPGRPRVPRRRRPVWGWAGAVAALAVAGIVLVFHGAIVSHPRTARVTVLSNVDGAASATANALRLTFSQPLDHGSTASAIRLSPATQVRSAWDGNTLMVTPVYGFAPNSAYVLTVDHAIARTVTGVPLAADMHVLFGTAPAAGQGSQHGNQNLAAAPLALNRVAGADDGSEALVAHDGSLLLTGAQAGPDTGNQQGLVRISNGKPTLVSAATDAMCISRSGQSVAYLSRTGGTRIVFADGTGTLSGSVPATVDPGSPLGWINDAEVVFVGGGRLKAVDHAGRVRTLSDAAVDATRDTVQVSPGGRYVYLRAASGATGRVIDLQTNATHALAGGTGDATFSADGATVAWFDTSGSAPVLDVAASGGGPVLAVPLPAAATDQLSDPGLSPDGYHFVYSVTAADHHTQLRLATLPDGRTVAAADGTVGQSPNWDASGKLFTVRTGGGNGSRIETVSVDPATDRLAALQALTTAFANAEIGADPGAQRALATADAGLPTLPRITRAAVLWVLPQPNGTANARLRLTIDPTSTDQPVAQQAEETLVLGPRPDGTFAVRAANVKEFQPAPAAPQVIRCDPDALPGAVLLTFDSDLDPDTVATAIGLNTSDGRTVPVMASYDAVNRTVTVQPRQAMTGPVVVRVDTGLRDIRGERPEAGLRVTVNLGD
jgi:Bacterial Ig-like domain